MEAPHQVLRYLTPVGHLPKERATEIFVKRKVPLTANVKVVPEMVRFQNPRRHPVPLHRLLEDDWRAHRKFAYVNARMARMEKMIENYNAYYGKQAAPMSTTHSYNQGYSSAAPVSYRVPQMLPKTVFSGPFQKVLHTPKCAHLHRRVGWQNTKSPKHGASEMAENMERVLQRKHYTSMNEGKGQEFPGDRLHETQVAAALRGFDETR